jgi:hypothetical protein
VLPDKIWVSKISHLKSIVPRIEHTLGVTAAKRLRGSERLISAAPLPSMDTPGSGRGLTLTVWSTVWLPSVSVKVYVPPSWRYSLALRRSLSQPSQPLLVTLPWPGHVEAELDVFRGGDTVHT